MTLRICLAFAGLLAGEFELRFSDGGEDPLDGTMMAAEGRDSVNGRRLEVP